MKWMYFFPPGRRRRLHQKPYSQWNTRYNCVNGNDWLDINFVFFWGFWIELVLTFFFCFQNNKLILIVCIWLLLLISRYLLSLTPFQEKKQPPPPTFNERKTWLFSPIMMIRIVCFNQTIFFFVRISYFHNDGHP